MRFLVAAVTLLVFAGSALSATIPTNTTPPGRFTQESRPGSGSTLTSGGLQLIKLSLTIHTIDKHHHDNGPLSGNRLHTDTRLLSNEKQVRGQD